MSRATGFCAMPIARTNTAKMRRATRNWGKIFPLVGHSSRTPWSTVHRIRGGIMAIKPITIGWLALAAMSAALAQTPVDTPPRTEDAAPPPPAFSRDRLIPIEMPSYVTLKIGVDPETIAVGADGVVRYVVIMQNASGSTHAAYEGILCAAGDVKTYARWGASQNWVPVSEPRWRSMTDNLPSRHAFAISKQGGCDGRTSARVADIVRALRLGSKPYL